MPEVRSIPRVSVCIPCFNYAHYLPDAVGSVLNQSFQDWEAIVTDDASTDNSWEVIQSFRDRRIISIRHLANRGNIGTYTEAYGRSRGEFIAMLSADDRYLPKFLESAVNMLDRHPEAGMVYTGCEIINAQGKTVRRMTNMPHKADGVYEESRLLLLGCHIAHSSVLIRRSVYEEIGGYDPVMSIAGDWDLWLKTARRYKIAFIQDALYQCRRHGKNMSVSAEALARQEGQIVAIFRRAVEALNPADDLEPVLRKARARHLYSFARWRLIRRDWRGGVSKIREAFQQDPALMASPRLLAGMALAALHGMTGRVVWRV
jgi:glycosyltransferase involved in cell wall biosynthesis